MRHIKKALNLFFIFYFSLFIFVSDLQAADQKVCSIAGDNFISLRSRSNLSNYLKYFYNRYSKNFDNNGLVYSSPSYGIEEFKEARSPREIISLVLYYKYRALNKENKAIEKIRAGIFEAYIILETKTAEGLSFEDAEAMFLMTRLIDGVPGLLNKEEKEKIMKLFTSYLKGGIATSDSENRAFVAAAHWQYLTNYLYRQKYLDVKEKNYYHSLIKKKVDQAINNTINRNGWYMEENNKLFSAHYHALSAFMLMFLGDQSGVTRYSELAKKMYFNLKKLSFTNGMVEARIGSRPVGNGAQFYLMMGMLGKYFGDDDYRVFLNYASGNRFFSDSKRPDRLEFHSTILGAEPNYHDDYAFSDAAEISLATIKLRDIKLECKNNFSQNIRSYRDGLFNIANHGNSLVVNNRKFILSKDGNYSQEVK